MAHTCKNCGAVADDPGHLCAPTVENLSCEFCGETDISSNHVCKAKIASIKYSCGSCGRVAADDTNLCKPNEIK